MSRGVENLLKRRSWSPMECK